MSTMSNNASTPDQMQTDSPQEEHRHVQFDAFKQSVRMALDEPLKGSWDAAERSFIDWAFRTWEISPHELQQGLIDVIAKCLQPAPPPISVQTAVPRGPTRFQQELAPYPTTTNSSQRPYREPSQLRQIPDYDEALSGDAAG